MLPALMINVLKNNREGWVDSSGELRNFVLPSLTYLTLFDPSTTFSFRSTTRVTS